MEEKIQKQGGKKECYRKRSRENMTEEQGGGGNTIRGGVDKGIQQIFGQSGKLKGKAIFHSTVPN